MVPRSALAALLAVALLVAAPTTGFDAGNLDAPAPDRTAPEPSTCAAGLAAPADDATASATTLVAPNGTDDRLENASAIAAARDAGWLTPLADDEPATAGDVLVHRFSLGGNATALLDRLASANGTGPTEAFRTLVGRPGVRFDYYGPTACPPEMVVNATVERGALRVVPDRADDRLYVVVDLDEAVFDPTGDRGPTTDEDETGFHEVALELTPESGLVGSTVEASTTYDTVEREASVESDGLVRLSPGPDPTVRGTATVAPGTELRVTLRPADAPTGPLSTVATVDRNGSFVARFDLVGVEEAVYDVGVAGVESVGPGRPLAVVGDVAAAAVDVPVQADGGHHLNVVATTTDGGFLFVWNASGGLVGRVSYFGPGTTFDQVELQPPVAENATVTVVAYRDVDGDRRFDRDDRPYRTNGSVVGVTGTTGGEEVARGPPPDSETPTPEPRTPTPGTAVPRSTTPTPTATATPTPRATEPTPRTPTSRAETPPTTDGTIPGPGAAGAAVALLVATLVARRRS